MGGFDGTSIVQTVEIYDPRLGSWMPGEPMKHARGYSAAAVLDQSIYVIGGVGDDGNVNAFVSFLSSLLYMILASSIFHQQ